MRKLGILLAIMLAATLGYSGTATASGHENLKEPVCDDVIGGIAGGAEGSPVDDTLAGAQADCNESFDEDKVNLHNTLCGLETDLTEMDEALGQIPAGAHEFLDDNVEPPLDENIQDIVDFDHPCDDETPPPPGDDDDEGDDDDDDTEVQAAVQRNNATADGGLPRTGGELFAGAGFALMSLGALGRRFLP